MAQKKQNMLQRFMSYYKPYKLLFGMDIFMSTVITATSLIYPLITREIINDVVPSGDFQRLIRCVVLVFIVYTVKMLATYWVSFYGHMMGVDIQNDMQRDLFTHMLTLPYRFFDEHKSGVLMSRIVNDLNGISELAHHGPENLLQTGGMLIGSFAILCSINMPLTLIIFAFIPAELALLIVLRKKRNEGFRESRRTIAEINGELQNSLGGIRVVKAFDNDEVEIKKFNRRAKDFRKARKTAYIAMAMFHSGMDYLLDLMYLAVLTAGGIYFFNGRVSMGDFAAYFLYIGSFLTPVRKLVMFVEQYEDGKTGFTRFCEIMDYPSETEKPDAQPISDFEGDVRFNNVSFAYGGKGERKVLDNISIHIKNGEKIALVGPSGGGKTTLCHLIPRFYDPIGGSITIGDTDVRDVTLSSLRRGIGIVQQDVYLFTGTIADNIAYANPDATREEIIAAAKKARIHEFIEKQPQGYDTYVGERGVMLSGGQKQRISIARIFLKNPQILILDEATSALDNVTEAALQQSLDELCHGRTTIMVAHRLSTVRDCNRIFFLTDEGIKEQGSHEELLALDGEYAKLYRSQFIPANELKFS